MKETQDTVVKKVRMEPRSELMAILEVPIFPGFKTVATSPFFERGAEVVFTGGNGGPYG
jgi:hypothetical protein